MINQLDLNSFSFPDCPRCDSHAVINDGKYKRRGKHEHRYKCKRCRYRFVKQKTDTAVKAWAVSTYAETGTTLTRIAKEIKQLFSLSVSHATVRNWVLKSATANTEFKAAGNVWHVDETVIHSNGEKWWIWIITDRKTRCILSWHVSNNRRKKNAEIVLDKAIKSAGREPAVMVSDGYLGYHSVFKHYDMIHIIDGAFGLNALIERINREVKKRLKYFKCNVSRQLVETLLTLWFDAYHKRYHHTLRCTPLQAPISTKV